MAGLLLKCSSNNSDSVHRKCKLTLNVLETLVGRTVISVVTWRNIIEITVVFITYCILIPAHQK
jgi:hypothetical protein